MRVVVALDDPRDGVVEVGGLPHVVDELEDSTHPVMVASKTKRELEEDHVPEDEDPEVEDFVEEVAVLALCDILKLRPGGFHNQAMHSDASVQVASVFTLATAELDGVPVRDPEMTVQAVGPETLVLRLPLAMARGRLVVNLSEPLALCAALEGEEQERFPFDGLEGRVGWQRAWVEDRVVGIGCWLVELDAGI